MPKGSAKRSARRRERPEFLLPYFPVESAWAFPADLYDTQGCSPCDVADIVAAEIVDEVSAASPWNPAGTLPSSLAGFAAAEAVERALSLAARSGSMDGVIVLSRDLSGEPRILADERYEREWRDGGYVGALWCVVRPLGPPVPVGILGDGFALADGTPVEDPIEFMARHAPLLAGGFRLMTRPMTGHLLYTAGSVMLGAKTDPAFLAHLQVLWHATKPLAARYAAFAADHYVFETSYENPFPHAAEGVRTRDPHGAARLVVAGKSGFIVPTPASEACCAVSGIGLGHVMPRSRDPDQESWIEIDGLLDAVAPGLAVGPDAVRAFLATDYGQGREAAERLETWLGEPVADTYVEDGTRVRLHDRGDLVFMTAEAHEDFEIIGWSGDGPPAGAMRH